MAANIETWFFNRQEYVEPREAARFLGLKYKTLLAHIAAGKLPTVQIESRHMIQLEELHTYAASRRPRQEQPERWI